MAAAPTTNQARTNLGPLTTAVSLPSTCFSHFAQCQTCGQAWEGQTCFASTSSSTTDYGVQDNTGCWPVTTSFVANPPIPLQGWGFYSPGISCPSGMVSACTATAGGHSDWAVQFGMNSGETAVGCCPTGFSCSNNGNAQTCVNVASSTTFEAITCQSGIIAVSSLVTLPQVLTTTVSSSLAVFTQSSYYLYAPLIQINWQASDRPTSTSLSSNPTSTSTGATNTSTNSATSSPSKGGLSAGASAGIGVGAALVVLALIGLGIWIGMKRRNLYKRAAAGSPPQETHYEMDVKSHPAPPAYPPHSPYKPYTAPNELPLTTPPAELPQTASRPTRSNGPVYEM